MTCTNTGSLPCTPQGLSFNTSNNRISTAGYNYDAAGNLLSDSTHSYNYDAESRITCVLDAYGQCSQNAVQYLYDADGHRVGKQQGNTLEDYVYDPQGHVVSVHDGSANLLRSELYSPEGRHVATWNSNGLFYNHADWLGTERVRTNASGNFVQGFTDTPYGMNLAYNPASDVSPMHFTGKQRDSESGLDYFEARYNESTIGRFMTPDPSGKDAARPDDPQTWNMYAYVGNNPMTLTDPTGLQDCEANNGTGCNTPASGVTGGRPKSPYGAKTKKAPSARSEVVKGALKVVGGVVAIGVVTAQPEVGVIAAVVGGMGGAASVVSGSTQIAGGATHTDTRAATEAVDAYGSPQGLIVGVASGGNTGLAQVATTMGDAAGVVGKPEGTIGAVDKVLTVVGLLTGGVQSAFDTVRDMVSPPSPPLPPLLALLQTGINYNSIERNSRRSHGTGQDKQQSSSVVHQRGHRFGRVDRLSELLS